MKGAIAQCLEDMVKNQFGKDKWETSLENAGMSKTAFFMPVQNIEDKNVMKLIDSVCKTVNISQAQAADAFGDYWVNVYAPKLYKAYFKNATSAKELILNMDGVHDSVTKNIKDATPPRFEYEWKDDKTLIMKYKSQRGLIVFLVGLIKGVGKHYNENIRVTQLGTNKVQIIFPN
ncbi:MAG: heme NO-binding domain-containing protein [Candidatus Methanoperedens sp.]|jgi:hypothetical protein|nr:heme NO-binding domain-containing protein [Candidatus Methanoperedens sp.]PKL54165.1 MAG: hypothetical protein CVV36_03415 [Candidatus Methanoperedenaceae archaeon HGW-Methanoperedenaceae-1]